MLYLSKSLENTKCCAALQDEFQEIVNEILAGVACGINSLHKGNEVLFERSHEGKEVLQKGKLIRKESPEDGARWLIDISSGKNIWVKEECINRDSQESEIRSEYPRYPEAWNTVTSKYKLWMKNEVQAVEHGKDTHDRAFFEKTWDEMEKIKRIVKREINWRLSEKVKLITTKEEGQDIEILGVKNMTIDQLKERFYGDHRYWWGPYSDYNPGSVKYVWHASEPWWDARTEYEMFIDEAEAEAKAKKILDKSENWQTALADLKKSYELSWLCQTAKVYEKNKRCLTLIQQLEAWHPNARKAVYHEQPSADSGTNFEKYGMYE